jgi:hypothetical protein
MEFRFTDGRTFAHEFTAEEPTDFIDALATFRALGITNPVVQKPFNAHLHFQRGHAWVWVKPFVYLAKWENPDVNYWNNVLLNAARTDAYCGKLDKFCGDVAEETMFWDKMDGMKNQYVGDSQ